MRPGSSMDVCRQKKERASLEILTALRSRTIRLTPMCASVWRHEAAGLIGLQGPCPQIARSDFFDEPDLLVSTVDSPSLCGTYVRECIDRRAPHDQPTRHYSKKP